MPDLYEYEGDTISSSDIGASLKKAGCCEGDVVFVHADIGAFGKLLCPDRNIFLKSICDSIKKSVGKTGTVIMPAFTYSFCHGDVFDVKRSKSSVGVLTEYFRNSENVARTLHPIFSVVIWGKNKEFFSDVGKDSFDRTSIFGKLHDNHGKIVFFGASFQSCTYIHYIEQMHGIPYRYMKTYKGAIINGGETRHDSCTFFVRDLERNVISDFSRLERDLLEKDRMNQVRLGKGIISMVDTKVLYDSCFQHLDRDIYFLLKQKPAE